MRSLEQRQRYAALKVRVKVARCQLKCALKACQRLARPRQLQATFAAPQVRRRRLGRKVQRAIECDERIGVALEACKRKPPVVVRDRIVRLQGKRAVEACQCILRALQGEEREAAVDVGGGLPRLQRKRALDAFERLGMPSARRLQQAKIVVRLGVVRIERDRPIEARLRLRVMIRALEGDAQTVVPGRIVGSQAHRLPEINERRFKSPEVHERRAAAAVGGGHARLQGECALVAGQRLLVAADLVRRAREIGLHRGIRRPQLCGGGDEADRLRAAPRACERKAEQVQGVAVARFAARYLAINRDRIRKTTLLLQGERLGELDAALINEHPHEIYKPGSHGMHRIALETSPSACFNGASQGSKRCH